MISIKNWNKFQHFKDRKPPWIKLHRDILEQRDISAISDRSFRVLIGLWLLASEDVDMKGGLPSVDDMVFRLRIDKCIIIKALDELKPFLILDDISAISEGYQVDSLEEEGEVEVEEDKTLNEPKAVSRFNEFWDEFADKRGKDGALKVWNRRKLDRIADAVIAGAIEYTIARGKERKYWKQAQGWLSDGRWDDVPVQATDNNESAYERVCRKSKEREAAGIAIDNTLALEAGF